MIELIVRNCNGNTVEYKFDSEIDFIYQFDTVGCENNIPMLDDEIIGLKINGLEVNNNHLEIVNDLYELFEQNIKTNS